MSRPGATQSGPGPAVALCAALILTWLAMDDVGFGDSGEIGTAAYTLGVAHPTGFAIDLLLLRAASFLPIGHIAFRQNLCTAWGAAAALGLLAAACDLIAQRIGVTRRSARWLGAGFAAAVLLPWATFLQAARCVEVYALALGAALLALAGAARGGAAANLSFLVIGLAPGLHVTAGLFALMVAAGVRIRRGMRGALRALAVRVPLVAAGALVLAYLPLASLRDPPVDWGDPEDPARMLAHLTAARIRSAYRAEMLGADPDAPFQVLSQWLELWPLLPFALVAIAIGVRRKPIAVLAPLALLCADLAYAVWINPMGARDRQVGHMAGAGLALLAGVGAAALWAAVTQLRRVHGTAFAAAAIALAVIAALVRVPRAELADGYAAGELHGSGGPLAAVPPRTLVLCSTDGPCAGGLFALHVELVRPDVEVLPAQHLWDATVLRRLRGVPRPSALLPTEPAPGQRRAAAESVLLALCTRPQPRPVWLQSAEPMPGLRSRLPLAGAPLPPYFRARAAAEPRAFARDALARLDRMRAARLPGGVARESRARHAWSSAYGALGEQALALHPAMGVRALRTAVALAPERAVPWANLALALEGTGDVRGAMAAIERSLAVDPARAGSWLQLARLSLHGGGPAAAQGVIDLARRAGIEDPRLDALRRQMATP